MRAFRVQKADGQCVYAVERIEAGGAELDGTRAVDDLMVEYDVNARRRSARDLDRFAQVGSRV